MKKLVALFLLGLFSLTVRAQIPAPGTFSLIPKVGVVFSKLTNYEVRHIYVNDVPGDDREYKAEFGPGFSAGLEGEYIVHPNIGVSLGLMYAHEGTDHELKEAEIGLDYLNVPLMANFYITPQFAFRLGAQVGFMIDNNLEDSSALNKVDFSVPFGIQYEYQNFMLGLRYNWGLTKVFGESKFFKEKNQVIQIDLGYRIRL